MPFQHHYHISPFLKRAASARLSEITDIQSTKCALLFEPDPSCKVQLIMEQSHWLRQCYFFFFFSLRSFETFSYFGRKQIKKRKISSHRSPRVAWNTSKEGHTSRVFVGKEGVRDNVVEKREEGEVFTLRVLIHYRKAEARSVTLSQ